MVTKRHVLVFVLGLFALGMVGVLLVLAASTSPAAPLPIDNAPQVSPGYMAKQDAETIIANGQAITAIVAGTRSMEPVLVGGEQILERIPKIPSEIESGDIITYASATHGVTIVHRVVTIGTDDFGWFVRTKGDNSQKIDDEIIRFPQVRGIVVAIIY